MPKRLLAMSVPRLSGVMLDNYAGKLSEDTGLREEIARSAIGPGRGLGLQVDADPLRQPRPPPKLVAAGAPSIQSQRTRANGADARSAGLPADLRASCAVTGSVAYRPRRLTGLLAAALFAWTMRPCCRLFRHLQELTDIR